MGRQYTQLSKWDNWVYSKDNGKLALHLFPYSSNDTPFPRLLLIKFNSFHILTCPNTQFINLCPFWLASACSLLILVGKNSVRRKFPQDSLNIQKVYFTENYFVHVLKFLSFLWPLCQWKQQDLGSWKTSLQQILFSVLFKPGMTKHRAITQGCGLNMDVWVIHRNNLNFNTFKWKKTPNPNIFRPTCMFYHI